ncbi:hypothetical protein WFZ85_02850 [Flavobacterium sp. j3]|uniref:Uncharacterized protein n=1 Tax=Flavobacterium aureirubrum TaxID=3133147 RepID=A0ABU9N1E4_9FLAO
MLTIVSNQDSSKIINALVYSENDFIGSTNDVGQIEINKNFKTLKIVKENYDDIELNLNELENMKWLIKLKPITYIILDDVIIKASRESVSSILNKIKSSRLKQNPKHLNYYQSNISFKFDSTTIFLFNNIIFLNEGLEINDENKVIYKGFIKTINDNFQEGFELKSNNFEIPIFAGVYCSLGSQEITPIFDIKLYNYELQESEDFFVLNFFPKKRNSKLLYNGYFIIDKNDFGIIELNMSLAKSQNNTWWTNSFDKKEKYEYKIKDDTFKFKFKKIDNSYFLESSSRVLNGIQTKGNHIGAKLECSLYNEQTINQNGLTFKKYDWINKKFK